MHESFVVELKGNFIAVRKKEEEENDFEIDLSEESLADLLKCFSELYEIYGKNFIRTSHYFLKQWYLDRIENLYYHFKNLGYFDQYIEEEDSNSILGWRFSLESKRIFWMNCFLLTEFARARPGQVNHIWPHLNALVKSFLSRIYQLIL